MLDFYNIKQKNGESFMTFLQRWRCLFNRYPRPVPDHKKMGIFIDNLTSEISYRLKLQCPPSFSKIIENGRKIEDAMAKKGELKLYKEGNDSSNSFNNNNNNNNNNNHNNDKPKFWTRNRNIVNDRVVDANNLKPQQPIFNLSCRALVSNQDNDAKSKPFFPNARKKFTNIGEPLQSALKTLLENKLITLPEARDFEPN